jgi:hypothetical protein
MERCIRKLSPLSLARASLRRRKDVASLQRGGASVENPNLNKSELPDSTCLQFFLRNKGGVKSRV